VFAVILFALAFTAALALLLARYAPNPAVGRAELRARQGDDPRPRMPAAQLRQLVIELLERLGLSVIEEELRGDERRLVAVRQEPLQGARYVVFIAPHPPGDVVEPPQIVELAEYVKSEWGAVGLLFTPYAIDKSGLPGLEAKLELVDGARLRQLVHEYLPTRLAELDRYRGFGVAPSPPGPESHAPLTTR
jgi:hypothetical protein